MTRIINETSHRSIPLSAGMSRSSPIKESQAEEFLAEPQLLLALDGSQAVLLAAVVVSFDGDYVNLRRTDIESDELNPVALALLPPEIEVGSKIKCEYFQYEIIG